MQRPLDSALRHAVRTIVLVVAIATAVLPASAQARVMLLFHSFNGSMLFGRFPHTFIELDGTLDADGRRVHENYGYTAVTLSTEILRGNVAGTVHVEEDKYLKSTNVHFAVPITDAQVAAIREEVARWRDAPGKTYNLETHNCIHFVARIAELVGLKATVPTAMVKRPKAWLNYVATLNPQLRAAPIG
jgi:hypothetical protein